MQRAWVWIREHKVIEGAFGLAFLFGILRRRKIAEHQREALALFLRSGPAVRNFAERAIAGMTILGFAQHASDDPAERQRQVAEAELAAAERELKRRVQWRDNLAVCVWASPGPRMVSGLEGLRIIRPLPMPEADPGMPVIPLEPGRQLAPGSRKPLKPTGAWMGLGDLPTQLWEPGPSFAFDYAPLRGFAPACVIHRQQLPEVANLHLQQAQEDVDAMTSPPPTLPSSPTEPPVSSPESGTA